MKKIISLALCIALSLLVLVSCGDNFSDDYLKYPVTDNTVERLDLNMYIITGDNTTTDAMKSVATRISGHTKLTYNTSLNITYVKASEYDAVVTDAINNGGANAPHIVLINSKSLFDSLNSADKLAELTSYLKTRDFGRLNTQITPALLEMSKVDNKLYTIPNNRIMGEYSYLVIDKEVAVQTLKYTNAELSSYTSYEDAQDLIEDMTQNGFDASQLVYVENGPYELRETRINENKFCNIISTPTVTAEDAFASCFAVVKNAETKYVDRAMQMIYAINNDIELRNFLQYGVRGANYEVEVVDKVQNIVRIKTGENIYDMNLIHTGNIFNADNCSELGWTNTKRAYGILQNNDAKSE